MTIQPTKRSSILIVGAGAAGLMAAKELSPHYRVTILEANETTGGRMRTIRDENAGAAIESGAEFIHGQLPLTLALLDQAGINYTEIEGDMFRVENGSWVKQEEMIEGWEELLEKMGAANETSTMEEFLSQYFSEAQYDALREHVRNFVQGFDLADTNRVSVTSLYQEWCNESERNFRINEGYGRLVDYLVKQISSDGCELHPSSIVKKVIWGTGKVRAETADNRSFEAERIILTVPVSVLQMHDKDASISFLPDIPEYLDAARQIGYGNVLKLVFQFKTAFWTNHQPGIGFVFSDETIPVWWTQLPDRAPILTGWVGGPPADELRSADHDRLTTLGLESLAAIFKTDPESLRELLDYSHTVNWAEQPFIQGGYSYSTPTSAAARKILNTPLSDTLYFAGEALYDGPRPGTVEAALNSGKKVADSIIRQLRDADVLPPY